ncbi:MAG: matrixin family metalloprotease [Myxococcales bacterium]
MQRPTRIGSVGLFMVALGSGLLFESDAEAYCRTTTSSHCADCPRDPVTGCSLTGVPVSWSSSCLSFSIDPNAVSAQVGEEAARRMLRAAFDTWQNVQCPPNGLPPSLHVDSRFGDTFCARVEYNPDQGNANAILFREGEWPYYDSGQPLATTSVRYDEATGQLLDADMEINASNPLNVDSTQSKSLELRWDLQSILTHEAGHFLGLDHSRVPGSIMKFSIQPLEISRTLGQDDVDAICALYPPDAPAACEPEPRGGFSPLCGMDPTSGGACAVAQPRERPGAESSALGGLVLMLAGCFVHRRRARDSRGRRRV